MVMVMLLSGMQLQKNRRFEQKRVTFMKQVEKDQRSSNEFSMRLEITASFFSDAAWAVAASPLLFFVLCHRCNARNLVFFVC